jgi:predicted MFS family arabinose efflux permease
MWKGPREGKSSILTILDLRERNYRLAVVNGWLVWLGDTFLNPNIVLSGFAAKLGAPGALIGLNLAPPEERSASIGLANSISGLFAFSTVLGGYLSDRLGFPALFLLAALFYALALYAGRKLPEEG